MSVPTQAGIAGRGSGNLFPKKIRESKKAAKSHSGLSVLRVQKVGEREIKTFFPLYLPSALPIINKRASDFDFKSLFCVSSHYFHSDRLKNARVHFFRLRVKSRLNF